MKTTVIAMAALLLGAAATAGLMLWEPWAGEGGHPEANQSLFGRVLLKDPVYGFNLTPGLPCGGQRGYSDIRVGAGVVVKDGMGNVLATGRVLSGTAVDDPHSTGVLCEFAFVVNDIPTADFYAIEVSHRGELTYARSELEARGWEVAFELGGD